MSRQSTMKELRAALKVVAPRVNSSLWIPALSSAFLKFDLTTDRRIAAAIGQFLVEAGDSFQELTEDPTTPPPPK